MYSEEELLQLTNVQLRFILNDLGQAQGGKKAELIQRVVDHLDDLPDNHVHQLPRDIQRQMDQPAKLTEDSPVTDLQDHLKLSDVSMQRFDEEHVLTIKDLKGIPFDRIIELKLPIRDDVTIKDFLFPQSAVQQKDLRNLLIVKQRSKERGQAPADTDEEEDHHSVTSNSTRGKEKKKRHRHSSHRSVSSTGESISDTDSDTESKLDLLPMQARKLPRPHKMVCPRIDAKGKEKKPKALEIPITDFMSESMRLLQRLALSEERKDAMKEYSDYLEFLVNKQCDYTANSILKFDDDFRRRVLYEKRNLNDVDYRRSIADKYFHSATRLKYDQTSANNYSFRSKGQYNWYNQPQQQQQPYTQQGPMPIGQQYTTQQNGIPVCINFQRNNCTRVPCNYLHQCSICNYSNHGSTACRNVGKPKAPFFQQRGPTQH